MRSGEFGVRSENIITLPALTQHPSRAAQYFFLFPSLVHPIHLCSSVFAYVATSPPYGPFIPHKATQLRRMFDTPVTTGMAGLDDRNGRMGASVFVPGVACVVGCMPTIP